MVAQDGKIFFICRTGVFLDRFNVFENGRTSTLLLTDFSDLQIINDASFLHKFESTIIGYTGTVCVNLKNKKRSEIKQLENLLMPYFYNGYFYYDDPYENQIVRCIYPSMQMEKLDIKNCRNYSIENEKIFYSLSSDNCVYEYDIGTNRKLYEFENSPEVMNFIDNKLIVGDTFSSGNWFLYDLNKNSIHDMGCRQNNQVNVVNDVIVSRHYENDEWKYALYSSEGEPLNIGLN